MVGAGAGEGAGDRRVGSGPAAGFSQEGSAGEVDWNVRAEFSATTTNGGGGKQEKVNGGQHEGKGVV